MNSSHTDDLLDRWFTCSPFAIHLYEICTTKDGGIVYSVLISTFRAQSLENPRTMSCHPRNNQCRNPDTPSAVLFYSYGQGTNKFASKQSVLDRGRAMRIGCSPRLHAANLPTKILDFRGSDSSIILISRGVILMSKGDFRECLNGAILAGIINLSREIGRKKDTRARKDDCRYVFKRWFQTGSGQRVSSQKCRNSP